MPLIILILYIIGLFILKIRFGHVEKLLINTNSNNYPLFLAAKYMLITVFVALLIINLIWEINILCQ